MADDGERNTQAGSRFPSPINHRGHRGHRDINVFSPVILCELCELCGEKTLIR